MAVAAASRPTPPPPPSGAWSARLSPSTRVASCSSTATAARPRSTPCRGPGADRGAPARPARGRRAAPRASRRAAEHRGRAGRPLDPDGTVLVTGGLSGLGALTARHLAGHGRQAPVADQPPRPRGARAPELIAELAELGCDGGGGRLRRLRPLPGRGADRRGPRRAPAHRRRPLRRHPRRRHVGSLDPRAPRHRPRSQGRRRLAPARADRGPRARRLRPLLLGRPAPSAPRARPTTPPPTPSSTRLPRRRAEGLAATSIGWGLWEEESELVARRRSRAAGAGSGWRRSRSSWACSCSTGARPRDAGAVLAAPLRISALRAAVRAGMLPPMLSGLVPAAAAVPRAPPRSPAVSRRCRRRSGRRSCWRSCGTTSPPSSATPRRRVDPTAAFKDLGFDSLGAVELRNRLAGRPGTARGDPRLRPPTPEAIAAYLLDQVAEGRPGRGPGRGRAAPRARRDPGGAAAGIGAAGDVARARGERAAVAGGDGDPPDCRDIDAMDIDQLVRQTLEPETSGG